MKKTLFVSLFVIGFAFLAEAQTNDRALGVRLGWGGELSYQHPMSGNTRLEVDLGLQGFSNGDIGISALYQWLFAETGNFNVYVGAGPQLGTYKGDSDRYFGLNVAGQVGVEYNLNEVPLQFSLDWRPSVAIVPSPGAFGYQGVALGIRYRF